MRETADHRAWLRSVAVAVAGAVLVSASAGCWAGNTHRLGSVMAEVEAAGSSTVAVATTDHREFVRSGKKSPEFVGLQRSSFGNPFDVKTASGKPLADDVSDAICASLRRKGFQATPIYVSHDEPATAIRRRLSDSGSRRAILVVLDALKSDTYSKVGFAADMGLSVFDAGGELLAQARVKADRSLGGSVMNASGHAAKVVPEAFKQVLEELLNQPDVVAALQG